jgi:hypothetical protein
MQVQDGWASSESLSLSVKSQSWTEGCNALFLFYRCTFMVFYGWPLL